MKAADEGLRKAIEDRRRKQNKFEVEQYIPKSKEKMYIPFTITKVGPKFMPELVIVAVHVYEAAGRSGHEFFSTATVTPAADVGTGLQLTRSGEAP